MRLIQTALTFDDVLLVPAFSQVLPRDTSLVTRLTRNISLNIPLVSAAMDTVTESRLAIAMAQEGGIGIIHKNLTADEQAKEVSRVKRHEFGIVTDPITVTANMKVRDAIALQRQHGISGLPVVQGRKVVGIVTNRDLRFEDRLDAPLSSVMTPQERLVTMKEGATLAEAQTLMHKHRLERVLIVNDAFELRGLATVKDIVKNTEHPAACKDSHGQLLVGAAVGVGDGTEEAPGEVVLFQGRSYKSYRGMGSLGAMTDGSADRYFQDPANNADKLVPEGVEGRVPYKGSVLQIIFQLVGGVRASMGYCGCATIEEMRTKPEFVQITSAGFRESHVHDVQITKEAPNYRSE